MMRMASHVNVHAFLMTGEHSHNVNKVKYFQCYNANIVFFYFSVIPHTFSCYFTADVAKFSTRIVKLTTVHTGPVANRTLNDTINFIRS